MNDKFTRNEKKTIEESKVTNQLKKQNLFYSKTSKHIHVKINFENVCTVIFLRIVKTFIQSRLLKK